MKANLRKISKNRVYSEDFKKRIVSDFEGGNYSVIELQKLHNISNSLIYGWIYKFSTFNKQGTRVVEMEESSLKKVRDLEEKVRELEAVIGRKQVNIDFLETMIEVAKEELDIDIKKKFSTPPSQDAGKNRKK